MRNLIFAIVVVLDLVASVPYILDSLKGKTKPNLASWSTWTLLNIIFITAGLAAGDSLNTVALGVTYLVGSIAILAIAIFRGTRQYTLFDGACQAMALIGIVLWQVTDSPDMALALAILVDIFAVMPTFRHAYLYPGEETWSTFALAALCALGFTLLATETSFSALAVTSEATVVNFAIASLILLRRKTLQTRQPSKA